MTTKAATGSRTATVERVCERIDQPLNEIA